MSVLNVCILLSLTVSVLGADNNRPQHPNQQPPIRPDVPPGFIRGPDGRIMSVNFPGVELIPGRQPAQRPPPPPRPQQPMQIPYGFTVGPDGRIVRATQPGLQPRLPGYQLPPGHHLVPGLRLPPGITASQYVPSRPPPYIESPSSSSSASWPSPPPAPRQFRPFFNFFGIRYPQGPRHPRPPPRH